MLRNLFYARIFHFAPNRNPNRNRILSTRHPIDEFLNTQRMGRMTLGNQWHAPIAWSRVSSVAASIPLPVSAKPEQDFQYPVIHNHVRRMDTNGG